VVSFDAYAAAPRQISALVGKNSAPWTVYSGSQVISLTTTRRTYTYSFTMNHETDSEARLGFDLGGSSIDVVFDNVVLQ
jgi:endoglucanase